MCIRDRSVKALEEQGAQFIICLSHSGTNAKASKSDDQQLAKKVDGIDLIISGHTHTTLEEPIVEGDTYICLLYTSWILLFLPSPAVPLSPPLSPWPTPSVRWAIRST